MTEFAAATLVAVTATTRAGDGDGAQQGPRGGLGRRALVRLNGVQIQYWGTRAAPAGDSVLNERACAVRKLMFATVNPVDDRLRLIGAPEHFQRNCTQSSAGRQEP